jgi:hypothetical protein
MSDPRNLIDGYFDETLSSDEHLELSQWIKADPQNARAFAQAALLHDRLRNLIELQTGSTLAFSHEKASLLNEERSRDESNDVETVSSPSRVSQQSRESTSPTLVSGEWANSWMTTTMGRSAIAASVLFAVLTLSWLTSGTSTASAAIRELDRIILSNMHSKDRTYEIVVEDVTLPAKRRGKRPLGPEMQRPPKPPLDGAVLHVRSGNQFVLIRKTAEGLPFITGSNGQQSWAINARGPTRISNDVREFNRDLPGHETSVPLLNVDEGLEQLKHAYDLQFSTLGPEEYLPEDGADVRLLVAIKKPRERGPQRVEIVYHSASGRILRMRFVQMPYGPNSLDLRLSLLSEEELPVDFFEPTSHDDSQQNLEMERSR